MTERGLPLVTGATACPFVAFEDDRDERASSPDHRHRCYAEIRPAPRALAHQEAYCLSSAFPVCPTFQDWARREAARARAAGDEAPVDTAPRRNPARQWSAPPPWRDGGGDAERDDAEDEAAEEELVGPGLAAAAASVAGASRIAERGTDADDPNADVRQAVDRDHQHAPPGFLAGRSRAGEGLAGSRADRLAAGESVAAGASLGSGERDADEEWAAPARGDDEYEDGSAPVEDRRPGLPARSARPQRVSQTRRSRPPVDPSTPAWEQPRRYEAYPRLKTPMSLPSLPRVGVMAVALGIAAIGLFFLPTLLGVGNSPEAGSTPTPSAAAGASASVAPTPVPVATPVAYVVRPGDTLEKIRRQFKVTMDALLAANPQITNPNKIKVGDQIVIPTAAPSEAPAESPSAAP